MPVPDADAALRRVEAARYALLRRLSLAIRHRMLAHLQPIGIMGEVLERRLHQAMPDLVRVGVDMARMHSLTRDAVQTNLDMVSWLEAEPEGAMPLDAGIGESVALLRGHFAYRGFALRHASSGAGPAVARATLRALLPAVLFALADEARAPGQLLVESEAASGTVRVRVQEEPQDGAEPAPPPYRLVAWEDVEALAAAENVMLAREADGVMLRFAPG